MEHVAARSLMLLVLFCTVSVKGGVGEGYLVFPFFLIVGVEKRKDMVMTYSLHCNMIKS